MFDPIDQFSMSIRDDICQVHTIADNNRRDLLVNRGNEKDCRMIQMWEPHAFEHHECEHIY